MKFKVGDKVRARKFPNFGPGIVIDVKRYNHFQFVVKHKTFNNIYTKFQLRKINA